MFGFDVLLLDIMFWEIPFVISLNAMKYPGFYTNHSLRTTAATWLFDAGVDEQLIMTRTGHRSVAGVRSYKRVTDNLNMLTSCVLNEQVPPAKKLKEEHEVVETEKAMPVGKNMKPIGKENTQPVLNFADPRISL